MSKVLLLFLIAITFFLVSCHQDSTSSIEESYWIDTLTCDFESFSNAKNSTVFLTTKKDFVINYNGIISSKITKSGNHALQINSNFNGNLFELNNLKKNQLVEISIWQKTGDSSAFILASLNNQATIIKSTYSALGKAKKGWFQHFISVPIFNDKSTLTFHIKTVDSIAIFDDLKVKIYPVMPNNKITKILQLYIPNKSKNKLNNYIDKALDKRVIPKSSKKYVTAFLVDGLDSNKIKMKLKGDWTDHIKPDKASYRLKLSKTTAYKGMVNFSIQHPKTRNFLNEWIIHKIAEDNDILTTTYDFINVTINDYNYGVYALEEHFDKHIIENRKRREGPILKFDESGVWAVQQEKFNNGLDKSLPFFESSFISVFKKNRTLKSPTLNAQFNDAKNLVQLFKNGYLNIENIFDLDQLALYYAIVELSGNRHALTWHNRRFYFNPISQKLEHILFDVIPYPNQENSIMKEIIMNTEKEPNLILDNAIILNKDFKDKYMTYIKLLTSKDYLDALFNNLDKDIAVIYPALKSEKPNYTFSKQDFYDQAQFILDGLEELNKNWDSKLNEAKDAHFWMKDQKYITITDSTFIPEISINTYYEKLENGKFKLSIENYHLNEITIKSYNGGSLDSILPLKEELKLDRYQTHPFTQVIYVDSIPKSINYTVKNVTGKIFNKKIIKWSLPQGTSSRMEIQYSFKPNSNLYSLKNNQLTFNSSCVIDELLYIPKKYEVIINSGTSIELKNGGGIIINNSLFCNGTKTNPINIFCLDKISNGITVLNGEIAQISHTKINGLSNFVYKNWTQTGALSIYETPTQIDNLTITNNTSEDALNIIRSNFEITHLTISETTSDGFDADFCTGSISNSTFTNTGNDCIDFSGSKISISNITIINSGDKGISGGEGSDLTLEGITINGAIIGIASKDNTKITGNSITISNAQTGLSAFQKKPIFGPASIDLEYSTIDNTKQLFLIELKSIIKFNSTIHEGTHKFDIDDLYKIY